MHPSSPSGSVESVTEPRPEAARAISGMVRDAAPSAERERRLTGEVVEALKDAGFFRMCVPRTYGGGECHPATLASVCEELGRADAAAGWCVAVTSTSGALGGYLAPDSAREIFGSPRSVSGGVFAPKGQAVPEGDALRVTGRWPFSSGIDHCDWVMGGCMVMEDGSPRMLPGGRPDVRLVIFPAGAVEVIDTWHVSGLRGTGSHDIALSGAPAPYARSVSLFTDEPRESGPLYAFPVFGLLALAIAATMLGIGRAAIDDVVELAGGKTPTGGRRSLAERTSTQSQLARADAGLRAGRAFLHEAIGAAWDEAATTGAVSTEQRAAVRMASTHAASSAAAAVDAAYDLGGGSSIYETSPLQRRFRDVHAATQHMLVAPGTWELTGRLLLGLPTDTAQL
jgi:alkylation response protein AidB-like acyl-CoA dehydrogenase